MEFHYSVKLKEWNYQNKSLTNISTIKQFILDNRLILGYTEEPVITFINYLVYCGGLIGLWFGTSAKDILIFLTNKQLFQIILSKLKLK